MAPQMYSHAPGELTRGRLRRLGEGIGKGVYASTDSGATWTARNTNLPAVSGYTYVGGICKAATGVIAAATDNSTYGVYRTTDEGMSWTKIDNGLPAWTPANSHPRTSPPPPIVTC